MLRIFPTGFLTSDVVFNGNGMQWDPQIAPILAYVPHVDDHMAEPLMLYIISMDMADPLLLSTCVRIHEPAYTYSFLHGIGIADVRATT